MLVNYLVHAAAEAAAPANPVSFDIWTLIWQSVNVLVIMAALYYLLFKPVGNILKKREEFVENSLASAAASKEEADRLLQQYQEQMKQASADAQKLIEKATQDADEYSRRKREEADREYDEMIERARKEIASERERAIEAIRDEMATLAVMAAGKVLGRAIEQQDHEALVKEFVAKVGEPH